MSKYKKAVLALICANLIWGFGPPIFKWSFENISPLTVAFFRFLIPTVLMLFFWKKMQRVRLRDGIYVVLAGLFGITINIGLYFLGLQYTASINQPVIASAGPIFIIVGSALFLRDRATKKILFGNLVGLAGILFIVLEPLFATHHMNSFWGNIILIFSTLSAALGTLIAKKLANRYNAFTLLFWTFLVATLSLLPVPFEEISHHTFLLHLNWQGFIGIFFGGIFSSLLGYGFLYYGLSIIKASETTIFSYVDPIAAVLVAIPLLHEYPNPIFLIGSFLVFLGIYIAEGRIHYHPLHKLFGV